MNRDFGLSLQHKIATNLYIISEFAKKNLYLCKISKKFRQINRQIYASFSLPFRLILASFSLLFRAERSHSETNRGAPPTEVKSQASRARAAGREGSAERQREDTERQREGAESQRGARREERAHTARQTELRAHGETQRGFSARENNRRMDRPHGD